MKAGKLRHKISFNLVNETKDSFGQMIQSDTQAFSAWAEIRNKSGGNSFIAGQHTEKTTHEVRVRYSSRIHEGLTFNFNSRKFEIEYIINIDQRNKELILICKEFS